VFSDSRSSRFTVIAPEFTPTQDRRRADDAHHVPFAGHRYQLLSR